jgi:hypothetical protein
MSVTHTGPADTHIRDYRESDLAVSGRFLGAREPIARTRNALHAHGPGNAR